jgi:hypothetical protein
MLKQMLSLLMVIFITLSCEKNDGNAPDLQSEGISKNTNELPITPSGPLPELAYTFETNVGLLNFDAAQSEKYQKAIEIVKLVVATEEFRNRVLNYSWDGTGTFANNRGRSNEEIYQSILDAAETLRPAKNNTMDLEVELYYQASTVVGYTNSGTTQIWVNTKYFNQYAPNSVAANLFHEWLHKLGYGHDVSATTQRPHSVPYAVGYMVGDIGKDFI